jgi:hypothetical protein
MLFLPPSRSHLCAMVGMVRRRSCNVSPRIEHCSLVLGRRHRSPIAKTRSGSFKVRELHQRGETAFAKSGDNRGSRVRSNLFPKRLRSRTRTRPSLYHQKEPNAIEFLSESLLDAGFGAVCLGGRNSCCQLQLRNRRARYRVGHARRDIGMRRELARPGQQTQRTIRR